MSKRRGSPRKTAQKGADEAPAHEDSSKDKDVREAWSRVVRHYGMRQAR